MKPQLTSARPCFVSFVLATACLVSPLSAQDWIETTAIPGFDHGDHGSHTGRELALEGDTLVFGSHTYTGDFNKQGRVDIYRREDQGTANRLDDIWVQEQILFPSDAGDDDRFGQSLCLRGDTLFVASPLDDDMGVDAGAIYRFERINGSWVEVEKFYGSDTVEGDWFGIETAIEEDVLVVSAINDDNEHGIDAGAAYVFRFDGLVWDEEAKLTRADGTDEDLFGRDVHVQGDEIFVSSVERAALDDAGGRLSIFGYDGVLGWIEKQSITGSDTVDGDAFAFEVEVHGDRLVASSVAADAMQGSVYVFVRDDNGTPGFVVDDLWLEQTKLVASDGQADDRFGRGLEIGETQILVGTWNSGVNTPESGSVYVFDLDDNGTPSNLLDDTWIESTELEASDAITGNRFGSMLQLTGETLIVGDPEYIDDGRVGAGRVYVLELAEPSNTEPRLVVVDSSADEAFEYDFSGELLNDSPLGAGNNAPVGLTADSAGFRWVIDNDDFVYVYDPAGVKIGGWKATGLRRPEGIATDGTHLWIVDRGTDRIHFFENGASRTGGSSGATSSFNLRSGNTNPRGLSTDGATLWVVNAGRKDRVYVYDISGSSLGYWQLDNANTNPSGVCVDGQGNLLTVDVTRSSVYFYEGGASRTSGSQAASGSFSLTLLNTAPQGISLSP